MMLISLQQPFRQAPFFTNILYTLPGAALRSGQLVDNTVGEIIKRNPFKLKLKYA